MKNIDMNSALEEKLYLLANNMTNKILKTININQKKGFIIAIDGPSGIGKTELCNRALINQLKLHKNNIFKFPFEEFLIERDKWNIIRKYILGEPLSKNESTFLNNEIIRFATPGESCKNELSLFWRLDEINTTLKHIRSWIENDGKENLTFEITNFWDRINATTHTKKEYSINPGSLIVIEGKFSIWKSFIKNANYDICFRLLDNFEPIIKRYWSRKYNLTKGESKTKKIEADRAVSFYHLLMGPSWVAYDIQTAGYIDWFVHMSTEKLSKTYPEVIGWEIFT